MLRTRNSDWKIEHQQSKYSKGKQVLGWKHMPSNFFDIPSLVKSSVGIWASTVERMAKWRRKSCSGGEINRHISSLGSRDGLEDPLEDTGLVQQQLDQLSTIGRCEYEKTCALLVQLFDQSAQSYQELLQSATASPMDIAVQEGEHVVGWAWEQALSVPFLSPPPSCLPSNSVLHHQLPPNMQKCIC